MNVQPSKLDIDRFRKVFVLIAAGGTEGERDAAKARAAAMAHSAGMTLEEAVAALDARSAASSTDPFEDLLKEARRARQARNAARKAEVLSRYQTVFRVFEQTEWERALRLAVQRYAEFFPATNPDGRKVHRTVKLDRLTGSVEISRLSKRVRKAIEAAYPFPPTLRGALDEIMAWDQLRLDRHPFTDREWEHEMEVEARVQMLAEMLDQSPASSWDDIDARFDWHQHSEARQWLDPESHREDGDPFISRLRADIAGLRRNATDDGFRRMSLGTAPTGHRSNAEKASSVIEMLRRSPELSDREVARRCGVSPQTATNWRGRLAGERA